jgi:two-component system, chemotaxis family, CheB/CheR fusion protein
MVAALSGIAILMADDDVDTLEVLRELVADEGATVRTASNARKALEVLRTWTPDVLLLDISMLDMEGCELLAAVRRQPALREILAVAVTGYGDARDRSRCTEAGFDAHITKPFEGETLVQLIATLVPHPHAA